MRPTVIISARRAWSRARDRDLLITAAHCINSGKGGSYRQDIVFIPDYRDGQAPFGIWAVKRLLVAPQWISGSDPSLDVGFVTLDPHDGQNIEDVLGANQLGIDSGYQYLVRVTGYPASADAPITCVNWTSRQSASQLRFECGGFAGGTSGSPWVTHFDPRTRNGTIVGVIGGYQEGGDTEAISYSSYLGAAVQRLYQRSGRRRGPMSRPLACSPVTGAVRIPLRRHGHFDRSSTSGARRMRRAPGSDVGDRADGGAWRGDGPALRVPVSGCVIHTPVGAAAIRRLRSYAPPCRFGPALGTY